MLKRGQWSVAELTRLREGYGRKPLSQLARELKRTKETVRQRAGQLFAGRLRIGELTESEIVELRKMVGIADLGTMALVLGRTESDLLRVLKGWAEADRKGRLAAWENEYLRQCYSSRADWAIRLVLGRGLPVIRRRARQMCLGKDRRIESVPVPLLEKLVVIRPHAPSRMPRWTATEIEQLENLYHDTSNLEIAKILGRSVKSVIAKANEMGLRKSVDRLRQMGRENVYRRHRAR